MHRKMEIVREILAAIAVGEDELHSYAIIRDLSKHPESDVLYHIHLMIEAGLLAGTIRHSLSERYASVVWITLTWTGNDAYDALKSPEVWDRTKAGLSKVSGWGFDTMLAVAKAYGKQVAGEKLGLHLG